MLHFTRPQTEQQSPLEVNVCDMAKGTKAEEGTPDESCSTHGWGDRHEDELPDYIYSGSQIPIPRAEET